MRQGQYRLNAAEVHHSASQLLNEQLQLGDYGHRCQASVLLQVLLYAAARMCSITAACSRLRGAPTDDAVRKAIVCQLPEIDELEQRLQLSLVGMVPAKLKRRRWRLAIDVVLIPYHGRPHRDMREVYRGEAKSGTTHFHAYATCYFVRKGQRFTVALARVELGTPMVEVVRLLLERARQAGIRPALLLLDRGFYAAEVVRYLQAARIPFILPVCFRGRKPSDPNGPSGTYVFKEAKQSGWQKYTWVSQSGTRATITICLKRCQVRRRGSKRVRLTTLVYACWGIEGCSTDWVRETYRKRFGIESSYRQMNQGRGRTSSRRPEWRLLYVALALLLRNLWVWLHWMVLAARHRGQRQLQLDRLRLQAMLNWLAHLAEEVLGILDYVDAEFLE